MQGTEPNEDSLDEFSGTKLALINKGRVLASLRDDKPDISFPGMWDFPGGARDGRESPIETAIREVKEELGIDISSQDVVWEKTYPAVVHPGKLAVFMVVKLSNKQISSIVFGDEGQEWKMMGFEDFLNHQNAVPGMKTRLKDYLTAQGIYKV